MKLVVVVIHYNNQSEKLSVSINGFQNILDAVANFKSSEPFLRLEFFDQENKKTSISNEQEWKQHFETISLVPVMIFNLVVGQVNNEEIKEETKETKIPTSPLMIDKMDIEEMIEKIEIDDSQEFHTSARKFFKNIQKNIVSFYQYNDNKLFEKMMKDFPQKIWLEHFESLKKNDSKEDIHKMLIYILMDTVNCFKQNYYKYENEKVSLRIQDNINLALKTKYYSNQDIISINEPKIKYTETKVFVDTRDCCEVARDMGILIPKCCMLNMASANHPNGGVFKGHWAQEENISRRSNYIYSLSNFEEIDYDRNWEYPIETYGGIYSPMVKIFRGTESEGYPYLKVPYFVNCIAVAALFRPPTDQKGRLSTEDAEKMEKKITTIFKISYDNGNEGIILGALGCGAFKNPPGHISEIFEKVIKKFSGCFKEIRFAIINDKNSLGDLQKTFIKKFGTEDSPRIFHMICEQGSMCTDRKDANHSKYYVHPKDCKDGGLCSELKNHDHLRNFCHPDICDKGGMCKDSSKEHRKLLIHPDNCIDLGYCKKYFDKEHSFFFAHPEMCKLGALCDNSSENHKREFLHPYIKCKHGGVCNDLEVESHLREFVHPGPCKFGGNCEELSNSKHIFEYCHPPICEKGGKCTNQTEDHLFFYIHPPICNYGGCCTYYTDDHEFVFKHPKLCKDKENCVENSLKHNIEYSHPKKSCKFGVKCSDVSVDHQKFFSHPYLPICKDGILCGNKEKKHREIFSHACLKGSTCIQINNPGHTINYLHLDLTMCHDGKECPLIRDREHLSKFFHPLDSQYKIPCKFGSNCLDTQYEHNMKFSHPCFSHGCCEVLNWNEGIDFSGNKDYLDKMMSGQIVDGKLLKTVAAYVKTNFHPIHRCKIDIFKMILKNGFLLSRDFMSKIQSDPRKYALQEVKQHKALSNLMQQNNYKMNDEFEKLSKRVIERKEIEIKKDPAQMSLLSTISTEIGALFQSISKFFKDPADLTKCVDHVSSIAESAFTQKLTGIGYVKDEEIQTNKQIFSIIGHHNGYHYGGIVFVLSQNIMHHPDFSMTPNAGTSFISGSALGNRPWANQGTNKNTEKYFASKLNAATPGWEETFAKELILQGGGKMKTIEEFEKSIVSRDSHAQFEGHMPSLVSFDFIEKIIISETDYKQLTKDEIETLQTHFKHKNNEWLIKYKDEKTPILNFKKEYLYKSPCSLSGFCVSIQEKYAEPVVIPQPIKNSNDFKINFDAKGTIFMLHLMSGTKKEDICYTISVESDKKSTIKKFDSVKSNYFIIGETESFHQGKDAKSFIAYELSYKNDTLVFEHSSKEKKRNLIKAKDKSPPTNIKYFAISCWRRLISFESILVQ
jgi:uncharacterized protein (TIGR02452 family)